MHVFIYYVPIKLGAEKRAKKNEGKCFIHKILVKYGI